MPPPGLIERVACDAGTGKRATGGNLWMIRAPVGSWARRVGSIHESFFDWCLRERVRLQETITFYPA